MSDFESENFNFLAYKLCGTLFLDDQEILSSRPKGVDIKIHGLIGRLCLANSTKEVTLTLALDNIAGIDQRKGRWEVWESGAMRFLRDATSRGFPLIGAFTFEGHDPLHFASCGAVYLRAMRDTRDISAIAILGTALEKAGVRQTSSMFLREAFRSIPSYPFERDCFGSNQSRSNSLFML